MSSLHELTRQTLQLDLHREPGPWLAELIHKIFSLESVAIFDRDLHAVYQAGEWSSDPTELTQNAYHFEATSDDVTTGISRRVLRLGAVPIGSLVLRGETSPLLNNAIADVAAMTFDRYRATANESRIEAEREAERLRTAVLDGLAHAYKTPLTAIRAAASGLQEMQKLSPAQADLVALIDDQARLLSDLTTRLLKTARLAGSEGEAGHIASTLQISAVSAASLMEEAGTLLGDRVADTQLELPEEELTLRCDRQMISLLLAQYIENACKYSDVGTPIVMCAQRMGDEAVFSVRNFGPVIPQADRERIFDRFYRSASGVAHAAGTGIGLSVAKRVALAHGGSVWAASGAEEGTTFFAAIPLNPATETEAVPAAAKQNRSSAL
jgi:two-component system sensor histidine kinase KdpD